MSNNQLPGGFSSFTSTPGVFGNAGSGGASLFGNTASNQNNNANASGTPAAPTASAFGGGNLFGSKPAGSLFGVTNTGSSSTPATPAPTGLFGQPATQQQTSTSNPGTPAPPSLGGGLFGTKPADQNASSTPKPSLFGNATAATGTTSATPNLFGKPAENTNSTASSTTPAPAAGSLFGGANLFGKKPDAPTATSTSAASAPAAAPTAPTTPSLFAGFGAKKDGAADTATDKPATQAPGTGLFGQPAANKDASSSSTPAPGFSLFGKPAEKKDTLAEEKKDSNAAPPASNFTSSTTTTNAAGISVPPPSMLRGKSIEEIVNKWSSDLETHVKEFGRLAGEVAVWDRALIDNGNTLAALFQHIAIAEREQADVEQSLKLVEDQQKELSSTLEVYEKAAGEVFDGQGGGLRALDVGPADAERDKHYTLAADLNANLDDLSRSLLQMIESVNALSTDEQNDSDGKPKGGAPIEQIAQILSSHLESLQWIDGAVREVDAKVNEVERAMRDGSGAPSRNGSIAPSMNGSVNGGNNLSRSRGFGLR